jgi:general secretion pathway protein F
MPQYHVRYVESARLQQRRVEAASIDGFAPALGIAPALIASVEEVAAAWRWSASRRFPLRLFSQELSVLLGAGIPLLEALQTLREKEASPSVAAALDGVIAPLRQGQALSAALQTQPDAFDELFVAVVSSAERTGQMRDALREHAAYLAWAEQLRSRLVSALVYPVLLVAASAAVVLFLLLFVVPRFAGVLDGMGDAQLPLASSLLMSAGQWASQHTTLTLLIAALLAAAPMLAWRTPGVREAMQLASWRLPAIGPRLRLLALTRLYRTAGMLLDAGVALVPALRTAAGVMAPRLRSDLARATDAVARGARLSAALQEHGLATPVALRMVRVGEQSGSLGPMLGEAARFHDDETQRVTDLVGRLINPLLMLVMGTVIGSIVVLLYLPIFQLAERVQ